MNRMDSAASSQQMAGFDDFGNEDLIYDLPKEAPNKFQQRVQERSMPKIAQTRTERMRNMPSDKGLEVTFQKSKASDPENSLQIRDSTHRVEFKIQETNTNK